MRYLVIKPKQSLPSINWSIGVATVGLALALTVSVPVFAVAKSWDAGNGSWYTANNWSPNGVPLGNEDIRIGNLPGVQNSTVLLGAPGSGYGSLEISSGMTLDLNGGELVSFGDALIKDANSRLIVRPAPGPNLYDFQGVLNVGEGAYLDLRDSAPVRLFGNSQSSGTISGRGEILLNSFTPFRNNGVIDPDGNGGIVLTQRSGSDLLAIDLDGANGAGQLLLSTPFSELEVNASSLADPFGSDIFMGVGALLTMNVTDGWVAQTSSAINVGGSNFPAAASQIAGSHLTFAGTINVGGAQGHLRVLAPATYLANANVNVGLTDWLEMDGATIVQGGQFTLSQGAQLDFDGSTVVQGGTFATFNDLLSDGGVKFNGATEYRGAIAVDGVAQQNGDATVAAPTVITAQRFDFSGADNLTNWNVNAPLVINTIDTRTDPLDSFAGVLDIGGGFLSRMTVNLAGGSQVAWGLSSTSQINLSGNATLFVDRIAGSTVINSGETNINARVAISADMIFLSASRINFATASSDLRMQGRTTLRNGADFSGEGTLYNGVGGEMRLESGATLAEVGLINQGDLHLFSVGPLGEASIAAVDRFTNDDQGTLHVRLGGYTLGEDFDHLQVTSGAAELDGQLFVEMFDAGGVEFLPVVGDEFTVLTAVGGVSGQFLADPVSFAHGRFFNWTVDYSPNHVTLRLDSISIPEPTSSVLVALSFGGMRCRRRSERTKQPAGNGLSEVRD